MNFLKFFGYFLEIKCDDAGIINYYLFIYLFIYQGAGKHPRQCCHPKCGRGPEGPEDKGHGHSRARGWPKHASPRARRARGRAKPSARFGACQCYYMFFTIQPKIASFMALFRYLNDG